MTDQLSAPFTLERRFAAPRSRVYAALTESAHLRHWMCPPGMNMVKCEADARVGGVFHYGMQAAMPGAPAMWGKWTFRALEQDQKIQVVVQFSDADGGVTRHPMAPNWPLYTLSTTTLSDDGEGTLVRLEWRALNASASEEAIFDASHASMAMGWGGAMDVLDGYLQQADK